MIISLIKKVFRNIFRHIIKLFEGHTPIPTAHSQAHFTIVRYGSHSVRYVKNFTLCMEAYTSLSFRKPSFTYAFQRMITYSYKTNRTQAHRFHSRLRQFIPSVRLSHALFWQMFIIYFAFLFRARGEYISLVS